MAAAPGLKPREQTSEFMLELFGQRFIWETYDPCFQLCDPYLQDCTGACKGVLWHWAVWDALVDGRPVAEGDAVGRKGAEKAARGAHAGFSRA